MDFILAFVPSWAGGVWTNGAPGCGSGSSGPPSGLSSRDVLWIIKKETGRGSGKSSRWGEKEWDGVSFQKKENRAVYEKPLPEPAKQLPVLSQPCSFGAGS